MNRLYKIYTGIAVGCTVLFGACKTEYPDLPYAEIETFTIEDAHGDPLQAVIKGDEIIIYWTPLEDEPETIRPVITLSEGASISPASGEVVPYSASTKYTVTAQDGSRKTYTFRPEGGQPIPYLNSINNTEININGVVALLGDYFLPDADKTKVYLMAGEQEYELTEFRRFTNSSIHSVIPITTELDTGYYDVKLVTGRYTLMAGQQIHLNAPTLSTLLDRTKLPPTTINPGQTFSVYFTHEQALKFYQEDDFIARMEYSDNTPVRNFDPQVTFVSATEVQMTIPTDIATGSAYFVLATTGSILNVIGQSVTIE
ncbi:hypothetical protein [Sphingobacterium gobiense]|uniref:DUF5018 domain-containing protein n=1 Tax=Sphingobacterium gobiense TaxID=1382456 RepID=A0A2S9JRC9_9SPHI|nr:hypothetical protein [Sphingobacterium gobiense]PRD55813.1 hypothetical protein C5749_00505 [Sphingobacterium gobiense]